MCVCVCVCIITLSAITKSMHYCYTWTVSRKLDQSVFKTQSSMISFLHIKNLEISNKNCLWLSKIQTEFWSLFPSSCSLQQHLFLIDCPYPVTQLNYSWLHISIKLQLYVLLRHQLDCTVRILRRDICGYGLVPVPNKVSRQINQWCCYRNNFTFHNFVEGLMMMMMMMIMMMVVINLYLVDSYRQMLKIH